MYTVAALAMDGATGLPGLDTVITTLTGAMSTIIGTITTSGNEILLIGVGKLILGFAICAVLTLVGMRRKRGR